MKVATGTIASTDPAAEARRIAQLLEPSRDAMAGEPLPRTVGSDRTNVPLTPEHQSPVRDNADEVIVEFTDGSLMRLTPSPGQIRVMHETKPPIRALLPGRCYRYEAVDASHASEFFQVEGLMVDEGTTMAHLRGLLDAFAHELFGAGRATRFRFNGSVAELAVRPAQARMAARVVRSMTA